MKNLLRAEEVMLLVLAVYLNTFLPYAWWAYWAWFLAPDLSMIGYAVNTRVGAVLYNLVHHKGIAIALCIVGYQFHMLEFTFAGLVMLGHSAFDRALGYGLKYPDNFKHTHLGMIGKP
jgi:hypothetical protein